MAGAQTPLDFVCEEDVRLAIQAGRKLVVSERAIVTPAARDLGEAAPSLHRRTLGADSQVQTDAHAEIHCRY